MYLKSLGNKKNNFIKEVTRYRVVSIDKARISDIRSFLVRIRQFGAGLERRTTF